jgi:hypothetical protein
MAALSRVMRRLDRSCRRNLSVRANGSGIGIDSAPRDIRDSRGARTMAVVLSTAIRMRRRFGGLVIGGGGGELDSTVLNDAVATQGHDHPARSVLASASTAATEPGSSAYTNQTALPTKRSAVRSTNHLATKRP